MSTQINYPTIESLVANTNQPFWSVMITTYKRTEYLKNCLRSVLKQDVLPQEMQIEVVDDCSPNRDEIEAIVKAIGKDRISFHSASKNVGIFANWNTCIQRAKGKWVHILSDDDKLAPNFYQAYGEIIHQHRCSAAVGQSIIIDEHDQWVGITQPLQKHSGLLEDAIPILSKPNPIRTPGIVVARKAYEKVGGFTTDLVYTPDWEMWSRLAVYTKVVYIHRPHSLFRQHSHSETNRLVLSGASITDTLSVSKIIQARIKDSVVRREVKRSILKWLHVSSLSISKPLVSQGYYQAALIHALWAFKLEPSLGSIKNVGAVFLKILIPILSQSISKVRTKIHATSDAS